MICPLHVVADLGPVIPGTPFETPRAAAPQEENGIIGQPLGRRAMG
ncbi:hypothetical protein J4G37_09590 [Microvirga sp. 3-52]|nr:hypothetical protein [Microvirga sp. 3-52]